MLPIKWRLAGIDKLPPELGIYPTSGELEARCDVKITIEFKAIAKRDVTHQVVLEVSAGARGGGVLEVSEQPGDAGVCACTSKGCWRRVHGEVGVTHQVALGLVCVCQYILHYIIC